MSWSVSSPLHSATLHQAAVRGGSRRARTRPPPVRCRCTNSTQLLETTTDSDAAWSTLYCSVLRIVGVIALAAWSLSRRFSGRLKNSAGPHSRAIVEASLQPQTRVGPHPDQVAHAISRIRCAVLCAVALLLPCLLPLPSATPLSAMFRLRPRSDTRTHTQALRAHDSRARKSSMETNDQDDLAAVLSQLVSRHVATRS